MYCASWCRAQCQHFFSSLLLEGILFKRSLLPRILGGALCPGLTVKALVEVTHMAQCLGCLSAIWILIQIQTWVIPTGQQVREIYMYGKTSQEGGKLAP